MSRLQCKRCLRPEHHCLCALIPTLDSRTRVLILQHPDEAKHALNTARFAALGLVNTELWIGERFDLSAILADLSYHSCLLFPDTDATPLAPYTEADKPLQLIVPDGTWRKARKLLYLNPELMALPKVSLASIKASRYRLRKAPMAESLSTLEAIVQALEVLEAADYSALLKPFDALIEGQIKAMGQGTYQRNYCAHKKGA